MTATLVEILPTDLMVGRINDVFGRADVADLVAGLDWYQAAHVFCAGLADTYGLELERCAGIVAALSPRVRWDLNQAYAVSMLKTGHAPVLSLSRHRAGEILAGGDPLVILRGDKVRSFYDNIVHYRTSRAVTIDRHAIDVAVGTHDDRTRKVLDRIGAYDMVADAYRAVADAAGVLPHQIQATTWVTWRRLKGLP